MFERGSRSPVTNFQHSDDSREPDALSSKYERHNDATAALTWEYSGESTMRRTQPIRAAFCETAIENTRGTR